MHPVTVISFKFEHGNPAQSQLYGFLEGVRMLLRLVFFAQRSYFTQVHGLSNSQSVSNPIFNQPFNLLLFFVQIIDCCQVIVLVHVLKEFL